MKNFFSIMALLALAACAYNVSMMPRDSGKIYTGSLSGNGMGSGSMSVTIDGVAYSGPAVRVASNDTFGFASTYGVNNRGQSATAVSTFSSIGDKYVKAILSGSDGRGLRCDFVGKFPTGGGICVDDQHKVYDAVIVAK